MPNNTFIMYRISSTRTDQVSGSLVFHRLFNLSLAHQVHFIKLNNRNTKITKCIYLQSTTKPNGYRFEDSLVVDFAICTLLLSGRKYYDFLHANSKGGLPSFRTVNRRIEELYPSVREGAINLTNLIYFLEKNNLEKIVCLSEDQTSIVSKIEYSDEFNSLVGYSYPLQKTGFLILTSVL